MNGTEVVYTELEKIVGTYNAGVTSGRKGFGALGNAWSGNVLLRGCAPVPPRKCPTQPSRPEMQALGATISWS